MDGVFAYMSKPSKSGKRRYVYQNFDTKEYSFDKLPNVEYKESKLVYSLTEHLQRMETIYASFKYVQPRWKRI